MTTKVVTAPAVTSLCPSGVKHPTTTVIAVSLSPDISTGQPNAYTENVLCGGLQLQLIIVLKCQFALQTGL